MTNRKKPDKNRITEEERIRAQKRETPLEFLLKVMWNPKIPAGLRLDAAKSAAPYVHKKMPVEMQHTGELNVIPPYVPGREQIAKEFDGKLKDVTPDIEYDDDFSDI